MKKMTRKLQLEVFCKTAEAYFDREITETKRRGDEHGVQIKALRRLRKAVRDSVAALGGEPYPASFRVNLKGRKHKMKKSMMTVGAALVAAVGFGYQVSLYSCQ